MLRTRLLSVLTCVLLLTNAATAFASAQSKAATEVATPEPGEVPVAAMQGLGEVHHQLVRSKKLDHDYHVFVRLPTNYRDGSEQRYPTVYLLDGGVTFPLLGSYYQYLRGGEEVPDLIIVGISYGNNEWGTGNLRGRDYTAPAESRDFYGGSAAFRAFLAGEVFPMVEGQFRSDSRRRIVFGQSIGGQFVIDTAQNAPSMFWGYIASNPALHRNLEYFLRPLGPSETTPAAPSASGEAVDGQRSGLFVASGSLDQERFREPALRWMEVWNLRAQEGALPWQLHTETLDGQSHMSAAPTSFRRGIAWLMSREP